MKINYQKIKYISIVLGCIYIFGYLWFGDYYLSMLSSATVFRISPGIALIILPLLSNNLLKFIVIRIASIMLGVIALINNFYAVIQIFSLQHKSDIIVAVLQLIGISIVIIVMLIRIIRRKRGQMKNAANKFNRKAQW